MSLRPFSLIDGLCFARDSTFKGLKFVFEEKQGSYRLTTCSSKLTSSSWASSKWREETLKVQKNHFYVLGPQSIE